MESKKQRTRGSGCVLQVKGSACWYIAYYAHGKQIRESSGSPVKAVAERLLRTRLGELDKGLTPNPSAHKLRYEDLREAFFTYYVKNGRKSVYIKKDGKASISSLNALDTFFKGWRVGEIASGIDRFIISRQEAGASNGTINRSLASLRKMFNLAVFNKRVPKEVCPNFEMLPEAAPRSGFVTVEEFHRLRTELPAYLKAPVTLLWATGMRKGEMQRLLWANLHSDTQGRENAVIRLDGTQTKNKKPRTIYLDSECIALLDMLKHAGPYVFGGDKPLGDFKCAWKSAATRAGLAGLLVHDLRRSAVRDMVRAGIAQKTAMERAGQVTDSIFRRYDIVDEVDAQQAMQKQAAYRQEQLALAAERARIAEDREAISQTGIQ